MADQGRVEESGPTEEGERLIARLFASTSSSRSRAGRTFAIATDRIEDRRPRDAEQAVYRGTRRADGKLEKVTEYAVQSLRAALHPDSARPLPGRFQRLLRIGSTSTTRLWRSCAWRSGWMRRPPPPERKHRPTLWLNSR